MSCFARENREIFFIPKLLINNTKRSVIYDIKHAIKTQNENIQYFTYR